MLSRLTLLMSCMLLLSACTHTPSYSYLDPRLQQREAAVRAYRSGDLLQAEGLLRKLLLSYPDDARAWLLLGNIHMRSQEFAAAHQAYQKASEYQPDDPVIWHNLAVSHLRLATTALIKGQEQRPGLETPPLLNWLLELQANPAPAS